MSFSGLHVPGELVAHSLFASFSLFASGSEGIAATEGQDCRSLLGTRTGRDVFSTSSLRNQGQKEIGLFVLGSVQTLTKKLPSQASLSQHRCMKHFL